MPFNLAGAFLLGVTALVCLGAESQTVWFGPMAFTSEREVRDDYIPMLTDTANWRDIAARADVFKSYIMILPPVPLPGNDAPEISDDELRRLIAVLAEQGLKTAFEVGGARSREAGAGHAAALGEFTWLRRWLDLGGKIDYLSTDHSIAFGLEKWLATKDPAESGAMSYQDPEVRQLINDLCEELAGYIEKMSELLPGVRIGAIDSLGYWWVEGEDGRVYEPSRPDIPDLPFAEIFARLVEAVEARGLRLDHFHSDFGHDGVRFDGAGTGKLNYGRVLAVEAAVRAAGIRSGNIVNAFHDAFHDKTLPEPESARSSAEAVNNTLAFFEGYMAAGQIPDDLVFQTWQPFPDKTGPETERDTVMHLHRSMMTHSAFPPDNCTALTPQEETSLPK
jgi:hypothetical protein